MRTTRSHKTTKKNYRQTIHKRRHKSRSTATCLGCSQNLPIFDLENINEVLRVHKTHIAEGKGSWKIVPKDSCEVYKQRRKRQAKSSRNEETDDNSMITSDSDNKVQCRKRKQKKYIENKAQRNSRQKSRPRGPNTRARRRSKHPSISTSPSTTSTYSSCFTSSEMDY